MITIEKIRFKNISQAGNIIKPNFHLNFGKKRIEKAINKGMPNSLLGELVDDVFTGGIFKRIFVQNQINGLPYISAQHMMHLCPNDVAKIISKRYTPRQNDMILKANQILVSCAGTVGNVRLISKDLEGVIGSQDIIRIVPNNCKMPYGYLYAYLASYTSFQYIQSYIYGSVVPRIEPNTLAKLPIPAFDKSLQDEIHCLIVDANILRDEANQILKDAQKRLMNVTGLQPLTKTDYEYFGTQTFGRPVSTFVRNIKEISNLSINAFNYSRRVEELESRVKACSYLPLFQCLDENEFFSTGSFKRLELEGSRSIKLLNQSDIFDIKKQGKMLARKFVKVDKLVEYGEVLIAGVGTLGESETFCRTIFANEELEGQLISGEFIRMRTIPNIPSGYLYCWLSSDYGFRLIRKTQAGTKLCRPIQELLRNLPVPIVSQKIMTKIDNAVRNAHTKQYEALCKENKAIELIENEIESWQE